MNGRLDKINQCGFARVIAPHYEINGLYYLKALGFISEAFIVAHFDAHIF
jgi:hypothetical protein